MKRILSTMFLASTFLSGVAIGQTSCDHFTAAIEDSAKELSFARTEGIGDNSAPRATSRKLGQSVQVGMIQANLLLMQANKCPMPKLPVNEKAYMDSAIGCSLAALSATGSNPVPECDRAKWVRK